MARVTGRSPVFLQVEIQGARVLVEDMIAIRTAVDAAAFKVVASAGFLLQETARSFHRSNIGTGETFKSITPTEGGVQGGGGDFYIEVGPETPQAYLLEYGFIHHLTGAFVASPFMMPAADFVEPIFENAIGQVGEIAGNRRQGSGHFGSAISSSISSVRSLLYNYSKLAGDVRVVGLDLPGRGAAIGAARTLGDVSAGMGGAVYQRLSARTTGHFASSGLRASVSANLAGSVGADSPLAARAWNRVSGVAAGRSIQSVQNL